MEEPVQRVSAQSAEQINQAKHPMPKGIFDINGEEEQEDHVPNQMKNPGVDEHREK